MSHTTLLDLSRWQWALTAAMHITFPAVTVGTSVFLVVCYAMDMRTDDEVWLRMFRFWRRIFGIGFALGVVSGIVLTFEFGLNWGRFAHDVGPIVGVIIAMEVVTAFFLEAGFLGLLVYGEGRIGKRMMLFATCMVSLGTLLSVTWILVANSWMQTPDGYRVVDGQFQPTNWLHVIFNPSFGIRFVHMLVGALIAAAWFIAGVSAWYLVKRRHLPIARRGVSITLGVLALLVPLQMLIGDHVAGDYVAKYKLPQLEAMEGNWNSTNSGENFAVIPKQGAAKNEWQVTVPWLGSAIAKDWSGHTAMPGLKLTQKELRPMMLPAFYGFHLILGRTRRSSPLSRPAPSAQRHAGPAPAPGRAAPRRAHRGPRHPDRRSTARRRPRVRPQRHARDRPPRPPIPAPAVDADHPRGAVMRPRAGDRRESLALALGGWGDGMRLRRRLIRAAEMARTQASRSSTRGRSWRRVTPSLRYAFCRWLSTVRMEMTSRSAISRLLEPAAASSAISRSRGVRSAASSAPSSVGGRAPSHCASQSAARAAATRALA
jgi:cytochrome d ubiquinol oxidase subunit I